MPLRSTTGPCVKGQALSLALLLSTAAQAQTQPQAPAAPPKAGAAAAGATAAPTTTASGLVFELKKAGQGAGPQASDTVKVHYRGTLADGTEFDSSYKRGQPAEFPLNRVIPCWTEGLQLMKPGAKAVLTCPPAIAYGSRGAGGVIPPNATLRFEVELIAVMR